MWRKSNRLGLSSGTREEGGEGEFQGRLVVSERLLVDMMPVPSENLVRTAIIEDFRNLGQS